MNDILVALRDLHKQAITERSHNYVASTCLRAIEEITMLRLRVAELDRELLTHVVTLCDRRTRSASSR